MKNLLPRFIHDKYLSEMGNQTVISGDFESLGLFVDISGFTSMTEKLMQHGKEGAEILANTLYSVFDPLINAVHAHHGLITGFAGDAFTALFPWDHFETPEMGYRHALAAAEFIRRHFMEQPQRPTKFGEFPFAVKLGLSTGKAYWGILRSQDKPYQHVYYFRGPAIDSCAQAEHQAEKSEFILSDPIYAKTQDHLQGVIRGESHWKIDHISPDFINVPATPTADLEWTANADVLLHFLPPDVVHMPVDGEFRQVVTVFINIEQMDSVAQLQKFIQPTFRLLQLYRGTLTRLDFGDKGCNLLLFWGAPIRFENDVERALNFLIDLKKEVRKVFHGDHKIFRAGVTCRTMYAGYAGGSLQGEYTSYGRGINLAARQMMQAEWGEVDLDHEVRQLATTQFEMSLKGNFEFKGFAEPLPVYILKDRKAEARSIFYQGRMVGRNTEMNKLREFLTPIFSDDEKRFTGTIVVYGEPGIGKSRLIYEIRQEILREELVWWAFCPCDEILQQSLNPFHYYLRRLFQFNPTGVDAENKKRFEAQLNDLIEKIDHMESKGENVAEIKSELERTRTILAGMLDMHYENSLFEQLDAKLRFENMLYAFKNLIKAMSLIRPVVISIDDLQWMDSDSKQMIKTLTRNIEEYPIAILCSSRYFDDGSKPKFELDDTVIQCEIDLNYLQDDGIRDIITQVTGDPVADEVIEFVKNKTQGNPFFVEQLTLNLKEQDLLVKNTATEKYELSTKELEDIPSNITSVLISRLDRLPMSVKHIVQTASVLGAEFDVSILSHMLTQDKELVGELKTATQAAIWTALSDIRYIFKHALMRDAAYEMQLKAQLRQTHNLAATAYRVIHEDDPAPYYTNLAYHYEKAEDVHNTMDYLEKAALRAKELYQNQQAIELFDKLIDMLRAKAGLTREELGLDLNIA